MHLTNERFSPAVVAVAVLVGLTENLASSSAEPICGDYGEPWVVVRAPADERYAHLAWPKIVKAPDGTLVLAYIAARRHVNGDGCPAFSISTDDGRTFEPPGILKQFGPGEEFVHSGNLALGLAGDGAVVLLAMAFSGDESNGIFGWRSTDSGRSWRDVDTSSLTGNRTGSVFGHVVAVPGRGLVVWGHYRQPKGTGIWFAWSEDDGRTWGPPQDVTDAKFFEPCFVHVGGRFIGLVRENRAQAYHQFLSDDMGKTWRMSERAVAGQSAVHPSPFVVVDPNSPNTLLCLQSQRTKTGEVYLWSADSERLDWRRRGLVVSFPDCEDYSYPWMTHLGGDEWFVVFYAGERDGPNSIYGMRLRTGG